MIQELIYYVRHNFSEVALLALTLGLTANALYASYRVRRLDALTNIPYSRMSQEQRKDLLRIAKTSQTREGDTLARLIS
jgi:hypothetical protein